MQMARAHAGKFLTLPLIKEAQIQTRYPFLPIDKNIFIFVTLLEKG